MLEFGNYRANWIYCDIDMQIVCKHEDDNLLAFCCAKIEAMYPHNLTEFKR